MVSHTCPIFKTGISSHANDFTQPLEFYGQTVAESEKIKKKKKTPFLYKRAE